MDCRPQDKFAIAKHPSDARWIVFVEKGGTWNRVCSTKTRRHARTIYPDAKLIPWPAKHVDRVSLDSFIVIAPAA